MDQKIHDILKKAGVAKGLTVDEADILLALLNDGMLPNLEDDLKKLVVEGKITEHEMYNALNVIDDCKTRMRNAQKKYIDTMEKATTDAVNRFAEQENAYYNQKMAQMKKLQQKLSSLS